MDSRGRLLLVDDDENIRVSLARALGFEGYEVATAENGEEALATLDGERFDALLLDVMMPGLSGLEVAKAIRGNDDSTPILMLTARHEVTDRVAGLDAGADDYLPKPFALDELLARIRALLRRGGVSEAGPELGLADLVVMPEARRAFRGDRELTLTRTEFDLLELLVFNAGIVLERDVILDRIWGFDFATSSNSLEVYIGYLRRKTEAQGEPRLIHTVRGVGYVARSE
ncbi:MAG TPA: response regulator transcription factor [Acidimicrobiia bacterium]|jgi:two-component system response regulator MprA